MTKKAAENNTISVCPNRVAPVITAIPKFLTGNSKIKAILCFLSIGIKNTTPKPTSKIEIFKTIASSIME